MAAEDTVSIAKDLRQTAVKMPGPRTSCARRADVAYLWPGRAPIVGTSRVLSPL